MSGPGGSKSSLNVAVFSMKPGGWAGSPCVVLWALCCLGADVVAGSASTSEQQEREEKLKLKLQQDLPRSLHVGLHPRRAEGLGEDVVSADHRKLRVPKLHRVASPHHRHPHQPLSHRALAAHKVERHRSKKHGHRGAKQLAKKQKWPGVSDIPEMPPLPEVQMPKMGLPKPSMPITLDKRPQAVSSLAEYCAPTGKGHTEDDLHLHQMVEGNWKDYDQWFSAEIVKINSDGTFDLSYDDGLEECCVPEERIRRKSGGSAPHLNAAMTDPVCQVSNIILDLNNKIDGAHKEIGKYLTFAQDSDVKGIKPGPPKFKTKTQLEEDQKAADAASGAGAPAGAPAGAAPAGSAVVASGEQAQMSGVDEAGKKLFDKYGDEEAVTSALDPDGDGQVSLDELKRVLTEEMGLSPEKADQLGNAILDKYAGGGDGPIAVGDIQQLVRGAAEKDAAATAAAAEEGEGEGEGEGEAAAAALGDADGKKTPEELEAMKQECSARDKELLERYAALGTFRDKVEELKNLWNEDKEDEGSPEPSTPEEMSTAIKKLKQKILDRGARLEDLLSREMEAESQAQASIGEVAEESASLLDNMQKEGTDIEALVKQLGEKSEVLKRAGELDPELRVQVSKVLGAASGMASKMLKIASTEKKLEHAEVAKGDGLQDQRKITVMHQALDDELKDLDQGFRVMRRDTDAFEEKVVPAGAKWWRYRWEYSFVEALLMGLLCLLAFLWENLHWWLKNWVIRKSELSPMFIKDYHASSLYASLSRFMFGEMFVMLLVVLSIWILNRSGLFEIVIRIQYQITDAVHLPNDAKTYNGLSYEIAMQMAVALMFFFCINLGVVGSATSNEQDVKTLEENHSATPRLPGTMIGMFAQDHAEFIHLKKAFYYHMKQFPQVEVMLRDEEEEKFLMWFFISRRVKLGVEMSFMIRPITWMCLFITFVVFAIMHRFVHTSYSFILGIFSVVLLLVFGWMYCVVHREAKLIKNYKEHVSRKSLERTPTQVGEDDLTAPKALRRFNLVSAMALTIQFPLTFLCYGASRVLFSPWMWEYFFNWTLAVFFLLISIFFLFHWIVAPYIVTYFIAMSFPPHTNEETDKLLVARTIDERKKSELREQLATGHRKRQSSLAISMA